MGETELVRRARLGDRRSFELLVDRHGPGLYSYGLRMLGDDAVTQDCVQETLIAAWLRLESFRGDSSISTWLFGIMANHVRKEYRRRDRHPTAPVSDTVPAQEHHAPEHETERSALVQALDAALAQLPPDQRSSWLLREVEGLSYEQIAAVQTTTVTVVRGRIARARENLTRRMEEWR